MILQSFHNSIAKGIAISLILSIYFAHLIPSLSYDFLYASSLLSFSFLSHHLFHSFFIMRSSPFSLSISIIFLIYFTVYHIYPFRSFSIYPFQSLPSIYFKSFLSLYLSISFYLFTTQQCNVCLQSKLDQSSKLKATPGFLFS